jgi:hypothetical protein
MGDYRFPAKISRIESISEKALGEREKKRSSRRFQVRTLLAPGSGAPWCSALFGRMANGLSQHSQGQRPWNPSDPMNRLANGHIQRTMR